MIEVDNYLEIDVCFFLTDSVVKMHIGRTSKQNSDQLCFMDFDYAWAPDYAYCQKQNIETNYHANCFTVFVIFW